MSGSIRQRAEEAQSRHKPVDRFDVFGKPTPEPGCSCCPWLVTWPCPDRIAADDTITDLNNLREKRSNLPVAFAVQLIDPDPPAASGSGGAQTTPNTA